MKAHHLLAPAAALLLAACQITPRAPLPEAPPPAKTETVVHFAPAAFADLPPTQDADWAAALPALLESCKVIGQRPAWRAACTEAARTPAAGARQFFESAFTPYQVLAVTLADGQEQSRSDAGLMTGYYEPLLRGSRIKAAPYLTPLHGMPDDLITVDLAALYPQLANLRLRGRIEGRKLVPYASRAEIVSGARPTGHELLWVDDPVAAFFLQVQGSGRVALPDGSQVRVGYAEQNGHPYQAIGRWLVAQGELKLDDVSLQSITDWARRNPQRRDELLNQNPSYVFFRESPVGDPAQGPRGALNVPLSPRASVAVDRRFIPLGAPLVVDAQQPATGLAFTRPVLAQDTGGAIRGPLRFDYFWGFGEEAGAQAGRQKSELRAWLLAPRGIEPGAL